MYVCVKPEDGGGGGKVIRLSGMLETGLEPMTFRLRIHLCYHNTTAITLLIQHYLSNCFYEIKQFDILCKLISF